MKLFVLLICVGLAICSSASTSGKLPTAKDISNDINENHQFNEETVEGSSSGRYSENMDSKTTLSQHTGNGNDFTNVSGTCDTASHIDCTRDAKPNGVIFAYICVSCSVCCVLIYPLLMLCHILHQTFSLKIKHDDHWDNDTTEVIDADLNATIGPVGCEPLIINQRPRKIRNNLTVN